MTASITDADPCFPGPPLGDREFRLFVTGLRLIYVIAVLTLLAKLLVFPGTRGSFGSTPMVASTASIASIASIASDVTSIHADFSSIADFTVGAGYVEFVPLPVEPRITFEFSHASTTKQPHESGKPEIAQRETSLPTPQRCDFTGD
jgi:hypothetical protein